MSRRFWNQIGEVPPLAGLPERMVPRDFGSGGAQQKTVTTNNQSSAAPWGAVQPYLQQVFGRAQDLYQTQPAISPYSQQAIDAMAARGARGSPTSQAMAQNLTDTLNGRYLDPSSNPYLAQAVSDALGQAKSQVVSLYGGQGTPGEQLNNSGFQEQLTRTLANTALPIYAQNYAAERNNQLQAAALAPNAAALDYQDIAAIAAAGQQQTDSPWQALARYQAALAGNYGGQSNSTTQRPVFTNPFATLLGLGIGGAGLYKMFGGGGGVGGGDTTVSGGGDLSNATYTDWA